MTSTVLSDNLRYSLRANRAVKKLSNEGYGLSEVARIAAMVMVTALHQDPFGDADECREELEALQQWQCRTMNARLLADAMKEEED